MVYTPRKNNQKKIFKVAIPIVLLLLLASFFAYQNGKPKQDDKNSGITICGYSSEKSKSLLSKEYKETYPFQDYLFYGESLALFANPYSGEPADGLSGKTVVLKDLCSKQEYAFVFDSGVDRKIKTEQLKAGFYEIYVVDDIKEKRLVSSEDITATLPSVGRAGKYHDVSLMASSELASSHGLSAESRYAFLEVKPTSDSKEVYDIAIDPAGNNQDFTTTNSKGSEGNGLVEAEESFKAAQMLKEKLEAQGFRVCILRNEDEEVNTYGADGRLDRAYRAKAKYYIRLGFHEASNTQFQGADIFYSAHSNGAFATQIIYELKRNTLLSPSTIYMGAGDEEGVIRSKLMKGMDGRVVYDDDLWIREAGGKATQAGMYSENAETGTAAFAKDNLYGMQGLNIQLGYLTNAEDAAYWKEHSDLIMTTLADAIAKYLGVSET